MESSILDPIDRYIEAYESLVRLSKDMYISIINRDLDSLLQITNSQSKVLSQLFMLGEETGLRYEKEDPELMMSDLPLEEQTKFREKLKYLGDLVLELNELVKINSRLLENSIELLHKYVEFLKKNPHITSILLENRG